MKLKYLNVRTDLLIHSAEKNKEQPVQLFLFMKYFYPNGKLKLERNEIDAFCLILKWNRRKFRRILKSLIEMKWVRYNKQNQYYLLKSIRKLKLSNYRDTRLIIECNIYDLQSLRALQGAAIFSLLYKNRIYKERKESKRSVFSMRSTFHPSKPFLRSSLKHVEIATTGASKIFNISVSKIDKLKKEAEKMNYISVKTNNIELEISEKEFNCIKKDPTLLTNMGFSGIRRVFTFNGGYYVRATDLICPIIHMKQGPKLNI